VGLASETASDADEGAGHAGGLALPDAGEIPAFLRRVA
jgi:hypothetical protein